MSEEDKKIIDALKDSSFINIDERNKEIRKSIKFYERTIEDLREALCCEQDPLKRIEIQDEINKGEVEINQRREQLKFKYKVEEKSALWRAQKNVQKHIKAGIKKLHIEVSDLRDYLNLDNFDTGYLIEYLPHKTLPAKWFLSPKSLSD